MQTHESHDNVRTKIVTALFVPLLLPFALVGVEVLLHEWWMGSSPAWWHRLRGEPRLSRRSGS